MRLSKALLLSFSLFGLSLNSAWSDDSAELSSEQQISVLQQQVKTLESQLNTSAKLDSSKTKHVIEARLGVKVDAIAETPLAGIYEVATSQGMFYVSNDGQYLIQGSLFDLVNRVNLTDASMAKVRIKQLASFEDDMIVFKAKDEKHVITVFTDTSCGYCRKLHNELYTYKDKNPQTKKIEELPGYTDLGITVRYLAFPRGGVDSPVYGEMQSVWCADDKAAAMSSAKNGRSIANASCNNNVIQQYQLGEAFGVRGTPAMVLEDGTMLPGYRPPAALLDYLNQG
ncbi:bifunctional protein-disulfide isomerase/oxidoreductase DsbC [Agarivorans sp. TSD2052]|uniref:bifunctional protein-disulfide isomerase/oxidoreductase DsbC n=1 Tax=Agarivorans sp. TSD2052 TaxID=2937286 RepID=UPI00200D366A|nr:bifunctional protein-disulfide isomerase/oxidoreductase DsbC [Agarivorans sp. TSD2052]UPW17811.1 bifunctional protein-disulfide isomerase/oxidoreductase DsbC [Agarivorans sp. TSD2052]